MHERLAPVEEDCLEHGPVGYPRRGSQDPLGVAGPRARHDRASTSPRTADDTLMFVLAAAALIPLAWLIGEATEHAAEHTGPGIGGFLNASFGNAPELIIALARDQRRPAAGRARLARRQRHLEPPARLRRSRRSSARTRRGSTAARCSTQLGLCRRRGRRCSSPGRPRLHGTTRAPRGGRRRRSRSRSLLLALYLAVDRPQPAPPQPQAERAEPRAAAWSLPLALAALGVATVATAFVSEILVHSLDAFAHAVGASEFFIAAVIVAIVGNAAEHGGAIVIARAGKMKLASEIAISSSAQVALLVTPGVMLLSLFFSHPLAAHVPLGGDRGDGRLRSWSSARWCATAGRAAARAGCWSASTCSSPWVSSSPGIAEPALRELGSAVEAAGYA